MADDRPGLHKRYGKKNIAAFNTRVKLPLALMGRISGPGSKIISSTVAEAVDFFTKRAEAAGKRTDVVQKRIVVEANLYVQRVLENLLSEMRGGGTGASVVMADSHTLEWMQWGAGGIEGAISKLDAYRKAASVNKPGYKAHMVFTPYKPDPGKKRKKINGSYGTYHSALYGKGEHVFHHPLKASKATKFQTVRTPAQRRFFFWMLSQFSEGPHPYAKRHDPPGAKNPKYYRYALGHQHSKANPHGNQNIIHRQRADSIGQPIPSIWDDVKLTCIDKEKAKWSLSFTSRESARIYAWLTKGTSDADAGGTDKMVGRASIKRRFEQKMRTEAKEQFGAILMRQVLKYND